MRHTVALAGLLLVACNSGPSTSDGSTEPVSDTNGITPISDPPISGLPSTPVASAEPVAAEAMMPDGTDLCWQDYCPCTDAVNALDHTICRNAKGGIEMSDDQWSIGAQAHDAKIEGDRASRDMKAIIDDMHSELRRNDASGVSPKPGSAEANDTSSSVTSM